MATYVYSQITLGGDRVSVCHRCHTLVQFGHEGAHTRLHDEVDAARAVQ